MTGTHNIFEFINNIGSVKERRVFCFEKEDLLTLFTWSSFFDYLFIDSDKNGINGLCVVYPIKKPFTDTEDWFFTFNPTPSKEDENNCNLCIMDFVALNATARSNIIQQFYKRYPNWKNQNKYALIRGKPKKVPNKYIEFLNIYGK